MNGVHAADEGRIGRDAEVPEYPRWQAWASFPLAAGPRRRSWRPPRCSAIAVAAVARSISETPPARRESTVPPYLCSRPYAFSGWRGSGAKIRRARGGWYSLPRLRSPILRLVVPSWVRASWTL